LLDLRGGKLRQHHEVMQAEPDDLRRDSPEDGDSTVGHADVPLLVQIEAQSEEPHDHDEHGGDRPHRDAPHHRTPRPPAGRPSACGPNPVSLGGHRRPRAGRIVAGPALRVLEREVEDDDRDVVHSSSSVGGPDELPHRVPRLGGVPKDPLDLLVRHHAREPVRTEEDAVPVLRVEHALIDLHVGLGTDGAYEHAPMRMNVGLLFCDLAAFHHPLDERVVLGQHAELAVTKEVGSGVPHVSES
jgi:hypothetical protein